MVLVENLYSPIVSPNQVPQSVMGVVGNLLPIMANVSMFLSNLLFLNELGQMESYPNPSIAAAFWPTIVGEKRVSGQQNLGST